MTSFYVLMVSWDQTPFFVLIGPTFFLIVFSSTEYLLFEHRRLHGDFILAFHIFHGCLEFPKAELFEAPAERDLRGHDYKLRKRSFRLLQRKAVFSLWLPISWNNLSTEMVGYPRLDILKRLIKLICFSKYPYPPWLPCSINLQFTGFEALSSAVVFGQ